MHVDRHRVYVHAGVDPDLPLGAQAFQGWSSHDRRSDKPRYASLVYRPAGNRHPPMMRLPAGRYPFSRFMASPSRAKRSELEHDSSLRRCRIEMANVDGPERDRGTCCFGRPLILTPAQ
jgi:hypothetical protein